MNSGVAIVEMLGGGHSCSAPSVNSTAIGSYFERGRVVRQDLSDQNEHEYVCLGEHPLPSVINGPPAARPTRVTGRDDVLEVARRPNRDPLSDCGMGEWSLVIARDESFSRRMFG